MNAYRFTAGLRRTLGVLAAALAAMSTPALVAAQTNPNFEYGVDRPGGDYRRFELQFDAPGLCAGQCAQDGRCRAWTYVRPGVQARGAMCWLKSVVPAPVRGANYAISGLRGTVAQAPVVPATMPQQATASGLTGRWFWGNLGYDFVQRGNSFTWVTADKRETATGTIDGNSLWANWGSNSGTGSITHRSAYGDPIRIQWSNGNVFTRSAPR